MKNRAFLLFISSLLFFSVIGYSLSAEDDLNPFVRVCILDDSDGFHLLIKGSYKTYALGTEKLLADGKYLSMDVRPLKDGIKIGKKDLKFRAIKVKIYTEAGIYVDGRRFRGDIDIIEKDNGRLMVINHLRVEDYLYGVLYHEVSHRWPMEALKAQAVAARTFAIYQVLQNRLQPYDLRNDIYSQVYGGRASEKWSTTRAIDLTKGVVLAYNGQIFPSYYHATCAGMTEDASRLWATDLPPLKGGVACVFCKDSPHYEWKKEIPLWSVQEKMRSGGYKIGKINFVDVLARDASGRIDKLEIKDDANVSIILTGKDFRQVVGPNEIRSTKFEPSVKWGHLILKGFGWGHGAGMCQWGAYGLARRGKKAEEILKFYYPGAEIRTITDLK